MKDVRRKKRNSLSNRKKALLAIITVGACLAVVIIASRAVRPAASVPSPQPDTRVKLFEAKEEQIASFTIQSPGETAYTILRTADGQYQVNAQPDFVLDEASLRPMIEAFLYFEAADIVGDTAARRLALGLRPDEQVSRISDADRWTYL